MDDYLERFKAMVEELKAHPDVVVTHFLTFPPVSERVISRIDRHLKVELHSSIKSFFRQTNGLQLKWIHRKDPKFNPSRQYIFSETPFSIHDVLGDDGHFTGCVNILPMADAFMNPEMWEGLSWFAGEDEDDERKSILPFDFFDFYYDMAFLLEDPDSDPIVMLGTDHLASHDDGFETRFETYMEYVLLQKGSVDSRQLGFWNVKGLDETRYELSDFNGLKPLDLDNIPL